MSKIQTYWPIFVAIIVAVVWITSTAISASFSAAEIKSDVEVNKRDIKKTLEKTDSHQDTIGKVNARLIVVESEVKHIRVHQSENHKDIKSELKILRQDIKKMSN
jgi:hypothetical protein